ncbi:MAG TPA: YbhB/YbcL family Raf kinase inhibitor-like protein [Candidatus Binatia bacterium]|jgi:Raf kinase inhibitor-like YbhB/YbcL family protein
MIHAKKFAVCALSTLLAGWTIAHGAEKSRPEIKSPAFQAGGDIPRKHTCDGGDVSPALSWTDAPVGTRAFALIIDDPDAPGGTWVHWVLYDLPGNAKELSEGIAADKPPGGAKQGVNDFRKAGYGGPCPPAGAPHRYFFKLYALDAPTDLKPGATKQQLLAAIKGHVLGEAELVGRYGR